MVHETCQNPHLDCDAQHYVLSMAQNACVTTAACKDVMQAWRLSVLKSSNDLNVLSHQSALDFSSVISQPLDTCSQMLTKMFEVALNP
jgi:hypothetical protein